MVRIFKLLVSNKAFMIKYKLSGIHCFSGRAALSGCDYVKSFVLMNVFTEIADCGFKKKEVFMLCRNFQ